MSEDITASKTDSFTIKINKNDFWKYSTFVLLIAVVVLGVMLYNSNDNSDVGTGNVVNTGTDPAAQQPAQISASVDDDAVLGDKNAKVTIIEFSDYQCPFCARFWSQTLPQIKKDYVDTGKVKFVYRDFPLTSIHPMAQKAAEAAECVGEKGGDKAYFEMHDAIYKNQAQLSLDNLKAWAKDLGYDISSCLDSGKYASEVQKDTSDAQASGGRGTPYFVIMKSGEKTGTALSGAQPFSTFKEAIDAQL